MNERIAMIGKQLTGIQAILRGQMHELVIDQRRQNTGLDRHFNHFKIESFRIHLQQRDFFKVMLIF